MIVRTYGRRNRGGTYSSDPLEDDVASDDPFDFSLSQDETLLPSSSSSSQDFFLNNGINSFTFSSQESSSFDPIGPGPSKKPKKRPRRDVAPPPAYFSNSTTLMEAQEYGEMMEHVDEVNFALDGLRKGHPVRIRRASLLSLLAICATAQQRRLLRTQGMAKTIIDAILGLGFDDSPSNLAAAAIFYVLTGDGQDDHLLESPESIKFLLKLLKPVTTTSSENKAHNIGSKLLALRKDSDIFRDTSKLADSTDSAIVSKVQELLVSCKDIKASCGKNSGIKLPELCPKWIALLTIEKACLSKISLEDISGMARETGGNFKGKLRELRGLDAVFEVMRDCYSVLETSSVQKLYTICDRRDDPSFQSLMLLLKCLKIMENATFLSKDNQSHLLGLKGKLDSHGDRLSFTELLLRVIKILSGLCLQKGSATSDGKLCNLSDGHDCTSDLAFLVDCKVDSHEVVCISSSTDCCSTERTFLENRLNVTQKSSACLGISTSSSETTTMSVNGSHQLRMRFHSSASSSFSETSRNYGGKHMSTGRLKTKFCVDERSNCSKDGEYGPLEDGQDPFAFDEDDFQPSKWDLMYGCDKKMSRSRTRKGGPKSRGLDNLCHSPSISLDELQVGEDYQQKSNAVDHCHSNGDATCSSDNEEHYALLSDCLLTAVKVLMNLTNENAIGCKQIAACGGLETMSSLIAGHFPSFSSSLSFCTEIREDVASIEVEERNDCHLTDQELDFLVAILGLLVNLVEKDGSNRSRLAAASVSLPGSEGLMEENREDVITLLCSIFLANQGAGDASEEGNLLPWNDEAALLQGEKEAEKMIVEAYAALLLAFLSTESKYIRDSIANCLPKNNLAILVPVLERFVAFHMTLNMISPETHKAVSEVIESCRLP